MSRTLEFGETKFVCADDFSGPVTVKRAGRSVELPHVGSLRDLLIDAMASHPKSQLDLTPIVLGRGAVLLPIGVLRDFLSVVDPDGPSMPSAPQGYEPTCEMRWAETNSWPMVAGVGAGPVFEDVRGKRWCLEQRWRQSEIPGIRSTRDCATAWVPVRTPSR